MGTSAIDLSSGIQPAKPAAGIDLNAGLQPSSQAPTSPPPAPASTSTPGLLDNLKDSLTNELPKEAGEAWQGAKKGGAETLSTLGKLFAPPGFKSGNALDLAPGAKAAVDKAAAAPVPDTTAGKTGYGLENIAEYLLGDEAVKGMSVGEKLSHLAPVMKTMEKYPRIAAVVQEGLKNLGLGTTQAAVHGATTGQALESGLIAGGTGGAAAALGEGIAGARAANAAGETRTAEREAAQAAYENRGAVTRERTEGLQSQRQATAQQGIRDVVKDSARRVASRVNEAMEPPLAVTGQPVEGVDFQPLNAEELAGRVNNFGDLADETRAAIKPIAQRLDDATDGELGRLQSERSQAFKSGDRTAQVEAEKKIDDLVSSHRDAVTPEQYSAWRTSYADSKVLDALHDATEKSFNGLSEELAAETGTGARRLRGTPYQNQLGKFLQNYGDTRVSRILGPDGLANLHRAANLVSSPEMRKATQRLAEQVAEEFPKPEPVAPESSLKDTIAKTGAKMAGGAAVGAAISHVTGLPHLVTEPAGAAVATGAKYVLQRMVTSPRIGQLMEYAVRNHVTPKTAASLISTAIMQENSPQIDQKTQPENPEPKSQAIYVTPSFVGVPPGMKKPGNVDLNSRPNIDNGDGTRSSVFSMSFGTDNGEVLVPGVGDGKTYPLRKLTPKEALDQFRKTGNNLGTFATPEDADRYAQQLHTDQAEKKEGQTP